MIFRSFTVQEFIRLSSGRSGPSFSLDFASLKLLLRSTSKEKLLLRSTSKEKLCESAVKNEPSPRWTKNQARTIAYPPTNPSHARVFWQASPLSIPGESSWGTAGKFVPRSEWKFPAQKFVHHDWQRSLSSALMQSRLAVVHANVQCMVS